MLIGYKIKFEKDGVAIEQHVVPDSSADANVVPGKITGLPATQKARVATNPLAVVADRGGDGPPSWSGHGPPDLQGSAPAPIFVLGPFIIGRDFGSFAEDSTKPASQQESEGPKAFSHKAGQ